jgi:hypothetical protein
MKPTLEILKSALKAAQMRLERAWQGEEFAAWLAAQAALLEAERALAAAQNEPHAVPIEFPVQWDIGAPLPYLLQNEDRTFLVFFLPGWDDNLAVVEFKRCSCTKMGPPSDEVFHGHPLYGKACDYIVRYEWRILFGSRNWRRAVKLPDAQV